MKRFLIKRALAERVVFLALAAVLAAGAQAVTNRSSYPVTEPYRFPVQPGTPEWTELDETGLARNACRMPAGLAEQMTSQALLETALDYPYVIDLLAYSDPVQGFWSNVRYNDALAELVKRRDAAAVVEAASEKLLVPEGEPDAKTTNRQKILAVFSQGLEHPPEM